MEDVRTIMDRLLSSAHGRAEKSLNTMVASSLLARNAGFQALQLAIDGLAQVRSVFNEAPSPLPLPTSLNDLAALSNTSPLFGSSLAYAKETVLHGGNAKALAAVQSFVSSMLAVGDKEFEAIAMSLASLAHVSFYGDRRDAFRNAYSAVRAARASKNDVLLIAVLEAVVSISFAFNDPDEGVRAATEALTLSRGLDDKRAVVRARKAIARGHMANENSEEALDASKLFLDEFAKDEIAKKTALAVSYDVNVFLGNTTAASETARDLLKAMKGDRDKEAAVTLLHGSVCTATKSALDACKKAASLFKDLKNPAGEAAALLAAANAGISQGGKSEQVESTNDTVDLFRRLGDKGGQAAALCLDAAWQLQKGRPLDAETACKESLNIFQELQNNVGSKFAEKLLKEISIAKSVPRPATVTLDAASGVAQVHLSDGSSGESLRAVSAELQAARGISCIVIHVEGSTDPNRPSRPGKDFGLFLMSLRMVGLPVIASISGSINGPIWAFVLACDYRIAATSSTFVCPPWGKPQCMGPFVGHNVATQLCMTVGPKDALVMLENGTVHQLQNGVADTKEAALQMARRISLTPAMACRRQPFILSSIVEEYAIAAAQGFAVPLG